MKNTKGLVLSGIIAGIIIVLVAYSINFQDDNGTNNENKNNKIVKDTGVYSGPITVLQYEHKLGESVFLHVRGLKPHENGNIYIFTPQEILFKKIPYDGSLKTDFNQYFTPDTFTLLQICTPEDLVGKWKIVFEDGSYPPLEFEILNEFIEGGEINIQVEC